MRTLTILAASLVATAVSAATDPGAALNSAKSHLAGKRYQEALQVAGAGIESASTLPSDSERRQALGALNFYAAAAAASAGDSRTATLFLEEFGRFSAMRKIDAARYDPAFVTLFNAILASASTEDQFAEIYPDYGSVKLPADKQALSVIEAAAVEILGSKSERRQFTDVGTSAARDTFLEAFWKRRDLTPATPSNDWRDQVYRRIAYADAAFASQPTQRGSLSDRGRVFVLVGRPAFVRRRPINRSDRVSVVGTEPNKNINGSMENWVYSRAQLPVPYSKPTVMYRFVTQEGVGDNVLQKDDAFAMNAVAEAARAAGGD
jgi:GWxTD domain-containing protein